MTVLPHPDEVIVWWLDLSAAAGPLELAVQRLTQSECERYSRLLSPESRARRIRARAGLREILGSLLDRAPAAVAIQLASEGRPVLGGDGPAPISFNLAHTGDVAAVAVSTREAVGVDIESLSGRAVSPALLARVLNESERADVERRPAAERTQAFLERWTAKEAYLKGLGVGLVREPASVGVLDDGGSLALLDTAADAPEWSLRRLAGPGGLVGTVAAPGGEFAVSEHPWGR